MPVDQLPGGIFHGGGSIKGIVKNPHEVHIIAGSLRGLREAREKSESSVTWEEKARGAVEYNVKPSAYNVSCGYRLLGDGLGRTRRGHLKCIS